MRSLLALARFAANQRIMLDARANIGVVVIGRNEGERLRRCFESLGLQSLHIVYVDSGSTDGSLELAESLKVQVVALDMSIPFTAARARNAGYKALVRAAPHLSFVQFVDGDCSLDPDWITIAHTALQGDAKLGIVTGWRSEIYPEKSIYNAICDVEWHRPAGVIEACGGDMMVRRTAFEAVQGFNPNVIAAEDDEFCIRVRGAGFEIQRLPHKMTYHDADMNHFSQWWQRAVRAGHGFAQVGDLHKGYFAGARKRVVFYAAVVPLLTIIGFTLHPLIGLAVLTIYAISFKRSTQGLLREFPDLGTSMAQRQALFLVISKFPNLIGFTKYYLRKMRGKSMQIIEYK